MVKTILIVMHFWGQQAFSFSTEFDSLYACEVAKNSIETIYLERHKRPEYLNNFIIICTQK
jgi:hypothetical protein